MKRNFFWILFISALIIFRGIFAGSVYWGDTPHFFPEEVSQFQTEPLAWTSLNSNFGGINLPLWLAPAMFLWKWIPPQMLFIIPSIILSVIGPIFLTRYLKSGKFVQFFSAAVYAFNTYYLLLIDGGQLGVALSYGFFPITILFLKKLVDEPKFKNFYPALFALTLNGLADPRIALVAVITVVVWNIARIKNLFSFVPLGISWLLLNAFWVTPFVKNKNAFASLGRLDITPVKLFDPLMLFSPHWPDNLFGKINSPPLYFIGIPILIFLGFYISRKRRDLTYLGCYILFSALSVIPIGVIFRDSTKFYIPAILFAGILIGRAVETLKKPWLGVGIFLYMIFLVYPAILGKMNFVLSARDHDRDFVKIYENLKRENGFFRIAWFPERHPLTYEAEDTPGVDAKEFVRFLPFASLNTGEDPFNFLNTADFVGNLRSLSVRYLILSGNPREIVRNQDEEKSWNGLVKLVEGTKGLEKMDWGTSFPIYKIPDTYPHFFSVGKLVGVVGGSISDVYPSVYFEDGKFDADILDTIDPGSFIIYFNRKKNDDLAMSLLKNYFVFPKDATSSEWATYVSEHYLKYKYQLLIRGINFTDLDYGGGIAFSTIQGEKMIFKFDVPQDGTYVIASRSMAESEGGNGLNWKVGEPQVLKKGDFVYTITNNSGFEVVNAVALIPSFKINEARAKADDYLQRFGRVKKNDLGKYTSYNKVDIQKEDTLKYKADLSSGDSWLIFTDTFNELWQAGKRSELSAHVPVYSFVNGFYVGGKSGDVEILFLGQKYFRAGVYISVGTLATLVLIYFYHEKFLKRSLKN